MKLPRWPDAWTWPRWSWSGLALPRWAKWLLAFFGGLFALLLLFIAISWAPDIPVDDLKERWAPAPSQFLMHHGVDVHLRDEGPRDDPVPIVLLHGTSSSLHTWDGWTTELKKTRRVIRFDLPGFGLTGPSPWNNYSIPIYVHFTVTLLDRLDVSRFVIAGNSLGGEIAWGVALAKPDRVTQLILVDSTGYAFEPYNVPAGFRVAMAGSPLGNTFLGHLLPPGMVGASIRAVYGVPARVKPEQIERYTALARREGNRAALRQRLVQLNAGQEHKIREIRTPTLILWGGRDRLVPPVYGRRFAQDIQGSEHVVFGTLGHIPQEEDPASTIEVVEKFLAKTN